MPLPGETILVFASFLAYKNQYLHVPLIILVGTLAAALGDNLGYWGGRKLGQRFLVRFKRWFHVDAQDIALGQDLIQRKGRQAIFAARFLLGLRILAGPLAGILKMDWKRFLLFNLMGAATWVSVIVLIGLEANGGGRLKLPELPAFNVRDLVLGVKV
ncbi:MAG TPA: DedA family protein [Terriglobia bacterium]|nr:DedA family protein [Terriglobia bacterium]